MKKIINLAVLSYTAFMILNSAIAKDWFVGPDASAEQSGCIRSPFASIIQAADVSKPGDRIVLLPGVHYVKSSAEITIHGTQEKPVKILSYDPADRAVLDGGRAKFEKDSHALLSLKDSSNVWVEDLDFVNSPGRGLSWHTGTNLVVRNCRFDRIYQRPLGGSGKNILIEGNLLTNSPTINEYGVLIKDTEHENYQIYGRSGAWPSVIHAASHWVPAGGAPRKASDNVVIRNNKILNCWGEGIMVTGCRNVLVEGNEVINVNVGLYIAFSDGVKIDRNVIKLELTAKAYHIDSYDKTRQWPQTAISLNNEGLSTDHPVEEIAGVKNVTLSNNLILGHGYGIYFWNDPYNKDKENSYENIRILHNVVAHQAKAAVKIDAIGLDKRTPSGCELINNILYQGTDGAYLELGNSEAWSVSHNVWVGDRTKVPDEDIAVDDPMLAMPKASYGAEGYRPHSWSSILNKGVAQNLVSHDFAGDSRNEQKPTPGIFELPFKSSEASVKSTNKE